MMSVDDFLKATYSGLNNDLKFAEAKNTALNHIQQRNDRANCGITS